MLEKVLTDGLRELGIPAPAGSVKKLRQYYTLLAEKNAVMDLTAVDGEDETARRHFLDSAAILRYVDIAGKSVVDVGTGAGFPGLPMAILVPEAKVTLLDAQQKRVDFLQEVCEACNVLATCIHGRAEDVAVQARERFDVAVSRAVARLNVLCELCMPLVKVGGSFVAMKGSAGAEELEEARNAIGVLGGKVERMETYTVPGEDILRSVIVVRKTQPTPVQYPRRFARIQKKPL